MKVLGYHHFESCGHGYFYIFWLILLTSKYKFRTMFAGGPLGGGGGAIIDTDTVSPSYVKRES